MKLAKTLDGASTPSRMVRCSGTAPKPSLAIGGGKWLAGIPRDERLRGSQKDKQSSRISSRFQFVQKFKPYPPREIICRSRFLQSRISQGKLFPASVIWGIMKVMENVKISFESEPEGSSLRVEDKVENDNAK